MPELNASIFGGEVSVGFGVIGIALLLPDGDFVDEGLFVPGMRARPSLAGGAIAIWRPPLEGEGPPFAVRGGVAAVQYLLEHLQTLARADLSPPGEVVAIGAA